MKWYPWLNGPYRQILAPYQQASGHHALLLSSQPGNGEASLCYALSRWLMCQQPDSIKSCGICPSCQLMMAENHPDFYQLGLEKNRQSLGIDNIRIIIDRLYSRAHQGGVKVVRLSHVELLTEQETNALLKILEEPPRDTYFLLDCRTPARLLPTLRSRCLYYLLPTPDESVGLYWLRQIGFDNPISACTALRLCSYAPLAASTLLQPARWQNRLALCTTLYEVHSNGDFLTLSSVLNLGKDDNPLRWLLSLLADALKWQQSGQAALINIDKVELIARLATNWSASVLHKQWKNWIQCLSQWQEIIGINRELLLTYYLLNWENSQNISEFPFDFKKI